MSSEEVASLAERRLALRERIRAQRQLIAERLDPAPDDRQSFPRSNVMRFLTKQPGLSVTLFAELAALLLGPRHARSIAAFMAVARIVRSAADSVPRAGTAGRSGSGHSGAT